MHACHCTPLGHIPESRGCWGSLPFVLQIQVLTCSLLIFLHSAVLGVLYARGQHLPGHFLSAAWLQLRVCICTHLCQDLPSSTGCPQLLSLGFALGTWCCIVSLECLLSLLGQVSLQLSNRLGLGTWWEKLSGSRVVVPGDRWDAVFQADHITVITVDWSYWQLCSSPPCGYHPPPHGYHQTSDLWVLFLTPQPSTLSDFFWLYIFVDSVFVTSSLPSI